MLPASGLPQTLNRPVPVLPRQPAGGALYPAHDAPAGKVGRPRLSMNGVGIQSRSSVRFMGAELLSLHVHDIVVHVGYFPPIDSRLSTWGCNNLKERSKLKTQPQVYMERA